MGESDLSGSTEHYPASPTGRDRWIIEHRAGVRNDDGIPIAEHRAALSPYEPYGFFLEEEPAAGGHIAPCVTILLTNRECPWRCAMCDLWRNTLTTTVPTGAIPSQIDHALNHLPPLSSRPAFPNLSSRPEQREVEGPEVVSEAGEDTSQRNEALHPTPYPPYPAVIKLYNAGSFFDPRAIPPEDDEAIAARMQHFERVIVECHPALLGERTLRFRDLIPGKLEVAMGLETVHPEALEKLNKRMTLEQFRSASDWLRKHDIDLRVFLLVQPPFVPPAEALDWACRSIDFAHDCGATAISLLTTRGGNGAMEALAATGDFISPSLNTVEAAFEYGLSQQRSRIFLDTWDIPTHLTCESCREARIARIKTMNLTQQIQPRVSQHEPGCPTSRF
ncbi:radical SAM protein [Silvibacterium dinghuense]|uniref:Radical SAM protein n=1 Tax=Silvibacterium dinghuense TaxID=1560006 RepID=A0A4Q1S9X2_9BACT|nr:radical SAM protein [Silvibacterium dinghuense]RXS93739.1 radical SAM protein [Silvibacterium dinghuense]